MKLAEQPVSGFTEALASDAPAPGGGSAAALMGAQGAALTAMVCALTLVKNPESSLASSTREKALALRLRFLEELDRDTEAFLTVSDAYAMPKATEAERQARSGAIQRGLDLCTQVPLRVMTLSREALALTEGLLGQFNENAASDLGVAALSLRSCAKGAWYNVRINIGSLKDKGLAAQYREQGETLLAEALSAAEAVERYIDGHL